MKFRLKDNILEQIAIDRITECDADEFMAILELMSGASVIEHSINDETYIIDTDTNNYAGMFDAFILDSDII